MGNVNLIPIFLTGLFAGGLTCLATQGGLLASAIAQREEERLKEKMLRRDSAQAALPILSFLTSKLVAYTILGFLLGSLGSIFQLSITTKIILTLAVSIFMIATALNILNVHPIFRYFIIQPPRFLTRMIRNQSKSKDLFAPAILGAFTVFIPCGTTQAMMALAIVSGSPILGALILFVFVLGTSPIFFILGYFATKLGDALQQKFMRFAAYVIILLAIFNMNNAWALSGSNFTLDNIWNKAYCTLYFCDSYVLAASNAVSQATIVIEATQYSPNNFTVKSGSSVTLNLINKSGTGCTQAFTIPSLGIQKIVPVGVSDTVQFTAPREPTQLAFMCSMGMFRGVINVI